MPALGSTKHIVANEQLSERLSNHNFGIYFNFFVLFNRLRLFASIEWSMFDVKSIDF